MHFTVQQEEVLVLQSLTGWKGFAKVYGYHLD